MGRARHQGATQCRGIAPGPGWRGPVGNPTDAERQRALTEAVAALPPGNNMAKAACAALGVSRATVMRRRAR